jgi:hypothetical protein
MTKKERASKKYGMLPPKIAESDIVTLGHGLCGSSGSIYNKDTSLNTLSVSLLALTIIDPAINIGWFEIVKATNKSATSIQDLFQNTWLARYQNLLNLLSLTMGSWENSNVSSKKCVTIMALKPNQLQITTIHAQANAIIERVHKVEQSQ